MKKIIFIFIFIFNASFAQNNEELFETANDLYKNGKYVEAINSYEQLIEENLISSEVYFNLGNSYYKLNKVAASIFNYEKSLQLNPANEDARNNLIFANRLTLDRIDTLPDSFFQNISNVYFKQLSINNWGIIAIIFSVLIAGFFLLFYYSYTPIKKRMFFVLGCISIILLISSLLIGFQEYNEFKNTKEAIVFAEQVSVQNEPTDSGIESFVLHEGTKMFVLDNVDVWTKIKLTDGKTGWMLTKNLKEL